jgi:hypothetical protein
MKCAKLMLGFSVAFVLVLCVFTPSEQAMASSGLPSVMSRIVVLPGHDTVFSSTGSMRSVKTGIILAANDGPNVQTADVRGRFFGGKVAMRYRPPVRDSVYGGMSYRPLVRVSELGEEGYSTSSFTVDVSFQKKKKQYGVKANSPAEITRPIVKKRVIRKKHYVKPQQRYDVKVPVIMPAPVIRDPRYPDAGGGSSNAPDLPRGQTCRTHRQTCRINPAAGDPMQCCLDYSCMFTGSNYNATCECPGGRWPPDFIIRDGRYRC